MPVELCGVDPEEQDFSPAEELLGEEFAPHDYKGVKPPHKNERLPPLAATVPDTIAEAYIGLQESAKLESDKSAANWLQPEIEKLRASVKTAEGKVADFRAANDIPVGQNNSALATQQLSEIANREKRSLSAQLAVIVEKFIAEHT